VAVVHAEEGDELAADPALDRDLPILHRGAITAGAGAVDARLVGHRTSPFSR
jgi:hypothetical protein